MGHGQRAARRDLSVYTAAAQGNRELISARHAHYVRPMGVSIKIAGGS
jgi:hypothetical protein